nr:alpha/beta hydrolase [Tellurirhabdus rosea]
MRGIYPSLQVSSRLDASAISSDPAVVEAYRKDPLVHGKITPGWFFGAFEAQQFAIDHVARIGVPTLVMHGTGDRIAAPSGSADLARNGGPNLTYRAWEGLFHELHNEPQRAEVLQFMVNWVDSKLQ